MTRFFKHHELIFFLLFCIMTLCCGCCNRYEVNFTASRTGIPVLLSATDRINEDTGLNKIQGDKYCPDDLWTITVHSSETISSGRFDDQSSCKNAAYVDKRVLKMSIGDPELNIQIDKMDISTTAVYYLFGIMDISKIRAHAYLKNIND